MDRLLMENLTPYLLAAGGAFLLYFTWKGRC
jgi:hypothetical protein